jgi:hypothetical protein
MYSFSEFKLIEASDNTKLDEIRLEISKNFDAIADAKSLKKDGDIASEIQSVDKQSAIYMTISNLMKNLSAELKNKQTAKPEQGSTNTY